MLTKSKSEITKEGSRAERVRWKFHRLVKCALAFHLNQVALLRICKSKDNCIIS
jgi:hypothetical protein